MGRYDPELRDFRKSPKQLAWELRDAIKDAAPFSGPVVDQRLSVEQRIELAESFQVWSETTLWPLARQLAVRAGLSLADFELGETAARGTSRRLRGMARRPR